MDDQTIVRLFWERDENALEAVKSLHGDYCHVIAKRILGNAEDAEECVNTMLLAAWNNIPPARPVFLRAFLGQITRRISIDYLRRKKSLRRGGDQVTLALEELAEDLPYYGDPASELEKKDLQITINHFIKDLKPADRSLFVLRYWHLESISSLAEIFGLKEANVNVKLHRIRIKLRQHLEKEGWNLS